MEDVKYTHCTVVLSDKSEFVAKVEEEGCYGYWGPTEVSVGDEWVPIDKFSKEYSCKDYRIEEPAAEEVA